MACMRGAEFPEVNEREARETQESNDKPLTKEGLAELNQLILKQWEIDKDDARTGTSMRMN